MPELDIINKENNKVGKINLAPEIFGVPVKEYLLHAVFINQRANKRQGTASAKSKGMVRGGGAKPWKQKGTGRARAGSNRSPLWKGGGAIFGPQPRDYRYKVPKQVRWAAINSALSSKAVSQDLVVIDKLDLSEPKTKIMVSILKKLGIEKSLLILIAKEEPVLERAARNIPEIMVKKVNSINIYDILSHKKLLLTPDVVKKIEEVFS